MFYARSQVSQIRSRGGGSVLVGCLLASCVFALACAQQAQGLTYYCSSECVKVAITPPKENETDKELFDVLRRQIYRRCLDICAATAFPHELWPVQALLSATPFGCAGKVRIVVIGRCFRRDGFGQKRCVRF